VGLNKDTEAFARIVREHQKAVFSVACAKMQNVHDAEDVKQDVFVEVWRNFHSFPLIDRVPSYLFTLTISRCKDHFRKKSRLKKREASYVETQAQQMQSLQEDPEIHDKVMQALSVLPEKIRIVMMLKHFAQLSYDEISRMTGLSKTTIDGRLRMGKKKMKQHLLRTKAI
jgi:RNA polymerase sigma factor (sigma-70 family)